VRVGVQRKAILAHLLESGSAGNFHFASSCD
jgi:hypothetical protein